MKKLLLTTKETAEHLGITPQEVRQLANENHLERIRGLKKPFRFSIYAINQYAGEKSYSNLTDYKTTKKLVMTTREAAAYLGISKDEIKKLISIECLSPLWGTRKPFKFSIFMVDRFLGKYKDSGLIDYEPTKKLVMTTRETAAYLGMPEGEIRKLANRNYLKPLKGFKSPFKFSIYVIDRYIGKQADPGPSEIEIMAENAFKWWI